MIFVTGPMYSGKEKCICEMLGITHEDFLERGVRDVEQLTEKDCDIEKLAEGLCQNEIVIASEIGAGVISTDPAQNAMRGRAGRLSQLLAKRAEVVVRVICGIPQIIKGTIEQHDNPAA